MIPAVTDLKELRESNDILGNREAMQQRIVRLASGVGIIRVGGATEVEMTEKKHRIEDALEAVSRYADSDLDQRYRELVPLAAEHYENTGLPFAVAALTLGRLYGLDKSDDMRKALAEQEGYLKDLAAGRASLNYEQPSTPDEPGRMTVNSRPSAFNWDGY